MLKEKAPAPVANSLWLRAANSTAAYRRFICLDHVLVSQEVNKLRVSRMLVAAKELKQHAAQCGKKTRAFTASKTQSG
jgi:hypothetical protein